MSENNINIFTGLNDLKEFEEVSSNSEDFSPTSPKSLKLEEVSSDSGENSSELEEVSSDSGEKSPNLEEVSSDSGEKSPKLEEVSSDFELKETNLELKETSSKLEKIITIPAAACDLCSILGYEGDLFYLGKSDFTSYMTDPHLCNKCFRRNGSMFFEKFNSITGTKLVFIENILEKKSKTDIHKIFSYVELVKHLDLPEPEKKGNLNKNWYFELLQEMINQNIDNHQLLIDAKFLYPNVNFKI
jgi:hypothetical protein